MNFLHKLLPITIHLALVGLFLFGSILDIPPVEASISGDQTSSYIYPLPPREDDLPPPESNLSEEQTSSESAVSSEPAVASRTENPLPTSSAVAASTPTSSPASSQPQTATPLPPQSSGNYVVGYYPSWGRNSGLSADELDASLLTHIHYAFADIGSDHRLTLAYPSTDLQNFKDLRSLKAAHPHLKTLISVGGWDYSKNFSSAAKTAESRQRFAKSCAEFVKEHDFDGIDLDWEFPTSSEKENFTLLLEAIRSSLDEQGRQDGKYYYLTVAYSPSPSLLSRIDAARVASLADYIFLMGYDIHGPWDRYADFNSPLYPSDEESPHFSLSLSEAVIGYKNAGIPAKKIVLGLPFYGYLYQTNGETNEGYFSSFSSAKSISFDKILSIFLNSDDYLWNFHEDFRIPYLYNSNVFLSYDDENSIAEKAAFAQQQGLAGVGAWELSQDQNFRLLQSAYNAMNQ